MTHPYRENGDKYEADYTANHFETLHLINGLERKLTNRRGKVLCCCDGTIAQVNECLANALSTAKKGDGGVSHVAEVCSKQGLKRIDKLLIR